jgi:hypothetical protein
VSERRARGRRVFWPGHACLSRPADSTGRTGRDSSFRARRGGVGMQAKLKSYPADPTSS